MCVHVCVCVRVCPCHIDVILEVFTFLAIIMQDASTGALHSLKKNKKKKETATNSHDEKCESTANQKINKTLTNVCHHEFYKLGCTASVCERGRGARRCE